MSYDEGVQLIRDIESGADTASANIGREYVKAHRALVDLMRAIRDNLGRYDAEWDGVYRCWSELLDWSRKHLGVTMGPGEYGGPDTLGVVFQGTQANKGP